MTNTTNLSETIMQSSGNKETIPFDRTISHDANKLKAVEENIASDWNIGDTILDLYEVTEILGKGGMGKVYKVYHKNWKMDLAVKSPLPEIVSTETGKENFIREAETWVNLGLHPNIVSCYYVRTLGNIPRVFAEYLEGGSLKDWINNEKLYEGGKERALERILDIAIQFAWGLDYAHEQGLIHQDIKPANVLLTIDGIAKVTDFGLAKARGMSGIENIESKGQSILVESGGYTPSYCSPEQASHKPLSRKTDIWSWGVSILEMFTGEITWASGSIAGHALDSYLEAGMESEDIPQIPKSISELLQKCFEEDPMNRPSNLTEIINILKEIYREETKKEYPRKESKSLDLLADGLNNKAISYLDLGKEEEAQKCWEEALKADAQHFESTFNYGYFQWQKAAITDDVLVTLMESIENVQKNNPGYWLCLGWIHYERGDIEAIEKIQHSEYQINDEKFIKALDHPDRPMGKEIRRFEGHTYSVNSVCFSPVGHYALSGSGDRTIRLWEISSGREIKRFEEHTHMIFSVSFSPDGQYALSGSYDKTIRLWDISSGKEIRRFEGHAGEVNSICFSPDDLFALSGSSDRTIRLWEISSGRVIKRFDNHTDRVSSVCFSPDGRYALSGSWDKTIRLWDISSGKEIRRFEGHTNIINSVCFSPDGRFAISGSNDYTVRLWEISSGSEIRRFEGHTHGVNSVCFSPDCLFALSGGKDATIRLWEVSSGRAMRKFEGHTNSVDSVCFSPDGRYVLSGSGGFVNSHDLTIRLWGIFYRMLSEYRYNHFPVLTKIRNIEELLVEKENINKILNIIKNNINSNDFDKAYKLIVEVQNQLEYEREKTVLDLKNICCIKGKFRRIGIKNGWFVNSIKGHADCINSVSFSPDSHYALSRSSDETIRLWDISSGKEIRRFEGQTNYVNSLSFSPDGRYALSGSFDCTVRLWEISTGREIKKFEGHEDEIISVSFSPDGRNAISGGIDKTIRLWDISSGKEIRRFDGHTEKVNSVCFSPDSCYALSGSEDTTIRFWDISSGKEIRKFEGHTYFVESVCFSPDGRYALSGSTDKIIHLWEISTGREIRRFEGHTNIINSVCFSPDGDYVLSGSIDRTIRLWEISSGSEIKRLERHTDIVSSVCFSPDGRYALSGSWDKTIILWEFDWEWEFPDNGENINQGKNEVADLQMQTLFHEKGKTVQHQTILSEDQTIVLNKLDDLASQFSTHLKEEIKYNEYPEEKFLCPKCKNSFVLSEATKIRIKRSPVIIILNILFFSASVYLPTLSLWCLILSIPVGFSQLINIAKAIMLKSNEYIQCPSCKKVLLIPKKK